MPDGSRVARLIIDDREDGIFRVHRSVFIDPDILERERVEADIVAALPPMS